MIAMLDALRSLVDRTFFFPVLIGIVLSTLQPIAAQQQSSDAGLKSRWSIEQGDGTLVLREGDQQIAIFHYRDRECLRPFFSGVQTPSGEKITRSFPPIAGVDPDDHASMHGGIWLAFGDINGEDFWRNKGRIQHVRFLKDPSVDGQGVSFVCLDELIDSSGKVIGTIDQSYRVRRFKHGCCLNWTATIGSGSAALVLGDQEEMGLGIRVATPMTEKNGGVILNSHGITGAKQTWGKTASWSDYSKIAEGQRKGVLLIPEASNFKPSWFHNRDYGLMVANCFGNKSFTGGEKSAVRIEAGENLKIGYRIIWYQTDRDTKLPLELLAGSTFDP